ncbi:NUDIX hydrolase [uncultured Thiohalocapsa sp.]|uniref:NUDIX hydrolase n=1 Tax=uncultured Thiohalocapsa sp. TaxID=768990 RepID=UPI0025F3BCF1|nr:NUDIX hydrolase [uncultured Thiohalocapsa sp.]
MTDWKRLSECVRVTSQWVTLIGERWLCDKGKELEYWRVEKADSVIVLPLQAGHIFCVAPTFRPGIGRATLDLPGGRLPADKAPHEVVPFLLQRELGIAPEAIRRTEPLNDAKWIVNSAFSNQGLWAFVAEIDPAFAIPQAMVGAKAAADVAGIAALLAQLDCLQCRAVLHEWQQRAL